MAIYDAVVVGGGMSGLSAAMELERSGASVVVLEASSRVGGRVHTDRSGATPLDLGGQWIGPQQLRVNALRERFHLETFPTPTTGDAIFDGGRVRRIGRVPYPGMIVAGFAMAPALMRLERMAARIHPAAPWASPNAARLDAITAEQWLRRSVRGRSARSIVSLLVSDSFATELDAISLLALLVGLKSVGGLAVAMGAEGGAQQDLFLDGADTIPTRMAAELRELRLESPVSAIMREGSRYRVVCGTGAVATDHVVVAMSPPLASRIDYSPALPALRDQLSQRTPIGTVVKTIAAYDTPFWRDSGLSGAVMSTRGLITTVADVSPPGGAGHLCMLTTGRDALALGRLDPGARRAAITAELVRLFGERAGHPRQWSEKLWADDPWTRGGYASNPTPGTLTMIGSAFTDAVDGIHWAGSEASDEWIGYIEGALASGERAALEILAGD